MCTRYTVGMTTNSTPAIVIATDDLFTAEFRIRNGITETRSYPTGTTPDDNWTTPPEFTDRITLAARFTAPTSLEDIAHRLSKNLGEYGNWHTVEILNTEAGA